MNKEIFKPTWSKRIVFWLAMSAATFLFVALLTGDLILDFIRLFISVLYILIGCFIFTLIFLSLPYFHVEVDGARLVGPSEWGIGWQRVEIPVAEIDLQNVSSTLGWLGFYVLKSKTGRKISLWAFDDRQFDRLMAILKDRRPDWVG